LTPAARASAAAAAAAVASGGHRMITLAPWLIRDWTFFDAVVEALDLILDRVQRQVVQFCGRRQLLQLPALAAHGEVTEVTACPLFVEPELPPAWILGAVHEPLQRHRAAGDPAERPIRNGKVVADQVELRVSGRPAGDRDRQRIRRVILAVPPRFAALDRAIGERGWLIVLLTRLSPGFVGGSGMVAPTLRVAAPKPWCLVRGVECGAKSTIIRPR